MNSYAAGKKCYDADSHLMERGDWLTSYADPALRSELPGFAPQGGGGTQAGRTILDLIERAEQRRTDAAATRELEKNVIAGPKGWLAHGATDPAEAGVPIVLHIGGGKLLDRRYHDNGRPLPEDWLGGGENLRAKDFPVVHHSPERFLTCLALDGVFERHPELRCGVIELGASWVPGMLRNLDFAAENLGRNEPLIRELALRPSEYIHRQVRFTPFSFEDVGWLIEDSGEDLFLFSSDYPHPEGGRDPIGRFDASLDARGIGRPARDRFYSENFTELIRE